MNEKTVLERALITQRLYDLENRVASIESKVNQMFVKQFKKKVIE